LKAVRMTGGDREEEEGEAGAVAQMVASELGCLRRLDRGFPFFAHLVGLERRLPGCILIPLEYVPGGNLYQHIRRHGPLPEPRVRLYAAELAAALDHLHNRHIIFRDLKTENILLAFDGHLKLSDFGLATFSPSNRAHSICGTPHTIAPEIVRREPYDHRVDWYSLGACLFECLEGEAPFGRQSRDVAGLLHSVLYRMPRLPKQLTGGCRAVLEGLLAKQPGQRIASLDQLLAMPWFLNWDQPSIVNKHQQPAFIPPSSRIRPLPRRFPDHDLLSFPDHHDNPNHHHILDDHSDSNPPLPSPDSSPVYPLSHLHPTAP